MWGPIIGAAIGAGGSLLGGMMGASGQAATNAAQIGFNQWSQLESQRFSHDEAQIARDWNAGQAQISRDYQTEMSNTAYQRAMQDMRKAGLNPMLAYMQGGAGTPIGATASGPSASGSPTSAGSLGNPGAAMGAGIASAAQLAQTHASLKVMGAQAAKDDSQTDLNKATEKYQDANVALNNVLQDKARQDTATSAAQQKQAESGARANDASAAERLANTLVLGHKANSAYEESRIQKRVADDTVRFGASPLSQTIGSILRIGRTAVDELVDKHQRGEAQPTYRTVPRRPPYAAPE